MGSPLATVTAPARWALSLALRAGPSPKTTWGRDGARFARGCLGAYPGWCGHPGTDFRLGLIEVRSVRRTRGNAGGR